MAAHPSMLTSGHTEHEGIVGDIPAYHSAGTDEGVATDRPTADDCGIGTDGGTAPDERALVQRMAVDLGAGVDDIGEDTGRTQEDIILDDDTGVDGNVVLYLDVAANDDI